MYIPLVMRFFPNGIVCKLWVYAPERYDWRKWKWPASIPVVARTNYWERTTYEMDGDLAKFAKSCNDLIRQVAFDKSGAVETEISQTNLYRGQVQYKFFELQEEIRPFIQREPDVPKDTNDVDTNKVRLLEYLGEGKVAILCVDWADEVHEVTIGRPTWLRICSGDAYTKSGKQYRYEGARYKTKWHFNTDHLGSLIVSYESMRGDGDDGDGFVGDIVDALVE
jgi:hypothetical protein